MAIDNYRAFYKEYLKALNEGNAGIFAGAGISKNEGFLDWKELLREAGDELGLCVDKETDLISLAQYYRNEKGKGPINQLLLDKFTSDSIETENVKLLASLPIKHYWTTNYDQIIENSLKNSKKTPDVIISQEDLSTTRPKRDAIVYKMHGDVNRPEEAVLTKDDYERFDKSRKLFKTVLQGDLISKTFLFIGFSFEDPNLDYVLSRIRVLIGENTRPHYSFFKSLNPEDYETIEDFNYAQAKQEHKIKDLKRYSIYPLMIDDYSEITDVLKQIQNKYRRQKIFISGAAEEYGSFQEGEAINMISVLSEKIANKDYKVISGFGLGIGSAVVNGVLKKVFNSNYQHIDENLTLRPFPQIGESKEEINKLWTDYRRNMISEAGIAIFLFGNKKEDGAIINSNGMREEFEIAKEMGVIPIPLGCTGYMAQELWEEISNSLGQYFKSDEEQRLIKELSDPEKEKDDIIETTLKLISKLQ